MKLLHVSERHGDLFFGLCATASESSETQCLLFFEAIEEHWVTEDGHPVAPYSLEPTFF